MAYATLAELRADGVAGDSVTTYTDSVVEAALDFASEFIEQITSQFFDVRTDTRVFDGSGTRRLVLDVPILTLTKVEWLSFGSTWQDVTTQNTFRLYNRIPQDQGYPKIEIYYGRDSLQTNVFGVFPEGPQNVRISGTWGWVENTAGTQSGATYATPRLINKACRILAVAWLDEIGDGSLLSVLRQYGVIEERTKHHSYKLSEAMSNGQLSGIPIVDQLLRPFMRKALAGHV